ncbi:MAG: hypothetical protein V1492_02470 [Candidatus Micrarchaeota archaeon]
MKSIQLQRRPAGKTPHIQSAKSFHADVVAFENIVNRIVSKPTKYPVLHVLDYLYSKNNFGWHNNPTVAKGNWKLIDTFNLPFTSAEGKTLTIKSLVRNGFVSAMVGDLYFSAIPQIGMLSVSDPRVAMRLLEFHLNDRKQIHRLDVNLVGMKGFAANMLLAHMVDRGFVKQEFLNSIMPQLR